MKLLINSLLLVLFGLGIYGASGLVYTEFTEGNGCPSIASIPACLIILICLVFPLISHFINKFNTIYFVLTGIAFSIALFASIRQFFDLGDCPKTSSGVPMCYFSLLIFTSLILLKYIYIKVLKNKI